MTGFSDTSGAALAGMTRKLDKLAKEFGLTHNQTQGLLGQALTKVGARVVEKLNQKLVQTTKKHNNWTANTFRYFKPSPNRLIIGARPSQASYIQFLVSGQADRRERDQKVTEQRAANGKLYIPTALFNKDGSIAQRLNLWKHMLDVAGGKTKDPTIFAGIPRGTGMPPGIYLRKQPNGRDSKTLVPWAYQVDKSHYDLRWDYQETAKEFIEEEIDGSVRDAVDSKVRKIMEGK
jgi:hypothetical protein